MRLHIVWYIQVTKEHLLVEDLYHQQQLTVATLRCECTQLEQMKALNEALSKEKEGYILRLSQLQLCNIYIYIYVFIDANNSLSVCKMEIMKLKQLLEEKQHRNK